MRIRSFIIAYALVLAILLFADRRPGSTQQDRYSHVVDLTDGRSATAQTFRGRGVQNPHYCSRCTYSRDLGRWADSARASRGSAGGYGFERAFDASPQISLDDIAAWESHHGMIPQGAVVAIRRAGALADISPAVVDV